MDKSGLQLAAAAVMPTLRENGIYELGLRMIFFSVYVPDFSE